MASTVCIRNLPNSSLVQTFFFLEDIIFNMTWSHQTLNIILQALSVHSHEDKHTFFSVLVANTIVCEYHFFIIEESHEVTHSLKFRRKFSDDIVVVIKFISFQQQYLMTLFAATSISFTWFWGTNWLHSYNFQITPFWKKNISSGSY